MFPCFTVKIKLATVDRDSCTLTSQQVTKASCPCACYVPKAGYEVLFVMEDATNQLLFPLLNNSFLLITHEESWINNILIVQRAFTLRIAFVITCNFSTDIDVILEYISVCYCFHNPIS